MKKNLALLAVVLIFSTSGCFFPKSDIRGLWFYTYTSRVGGFGDSSFTPASFINLQRDGSYTRDFGSFESGHWEQNKSGLILHASNSKTFIIKINSLAANELELSADDGSKLDFEKRPGKFESDDENPFAVENNQWRIPASTKETEDGLKKRLLNHCRFYELYFRWALDNDLSSIDVRSTPSLIKIYGNGFALKEYNDLPRNWRSSFFDEEDCRKANDIIKDIFEHKDITWVQTDNKYKMFITAFQQLEKLLK